MPWQCNYFSTDLPNKEGQYLTASPTALPYKECEW